MEVMNRGHYEIAMRVLLFILGVFAVIVSIEKPAEARRGAWCANYNMAAVPRIAALGSLTISLAILHPHRARRWK